MSRAVLGAVLVLAVAAALAWPASRSGAPPATRVLSVAVEPRSGPPAMGSGFVAGPGRVVTAAHLLARRARIEVRAAGAWARRARLLLVDRRSDLALLAVPGLRGQPLRMAAAGEAVRLLLRRDGRAVTRPARVRRAIRAHVRTSPGARPRSRPALELAARIAAGDSGAPVVTPRGELAGVLFARSRDHARRAYAVDASAMAAVLGRAERRERHQLRRGSEAGRGPGVTRSTFRGNIAQNVERVRDPGGERARSTFRCRISGKTSSASGIYARGADAFDVLPVMGA